MKRKRGTSILEGGIGEGRYLCESKNRKKYGGNEIGR